MRFSKVEAFAIRYPVREPIKDATHDLTGAQLKGWPSGAPRTTIEGPGSAVARAIALGRSATSSTRSAGIPNDRPKATRSGFTRSHAYALP